MEDAVLIKKEIILSSAEIFSSVFSMGYDSHTNSSQCLTTLVKYLLLHLPWSFVVLDGREKRKRRNKPTNDKQFERVYTLRVITPNA